MEWNWYINSFEKLISCIPRNTYTKIGTIQRRLAWPLRKDDTQNREAFHIFCTAPQIPLVGLQHFVESWPKKIPPEQGLEPWTVRLKA